MANRQAILIYLGILMAAIAVAVVGLRLKARRVKRLRLGVNDYTILAALILCINISLATGSC